MFDGFAVKTVLCVYPREHDRLATFPTPSSSAVFRLEMSSQKESSEPLKAIVFADSCETDREPDLSFGKLLGNVSILTWQLTALARFGVKHAIVLSAFPVDSVYSDPLERLKVDYLSSSTWNGEGDALRDLETRDNLCPIDDFVLVRPGTVFNIDVSALVAAHKKRRLLDRNWLISSVFRRAAGSSLTGLTIAVDAKSGTLVKYSNSISEGGLSIDVNAEHANLQNGGQMNIYSDVMDVGLDICSPEILVEFRENFYFSHVRAYVQEKLDGGEAEVFGNRMFAHLTDSSCGEYAARVTSLASLSQTTLDILNGWMTPIAPYASNSYKKQKPDTIHDQQNYYTDRVILGSSVSVGDSSAIFESVIGNDVTIGSEVTISRCVIADGCVIGDRCDLFCSIVDQDCRVQNDCTIPRKCYLDEAVCLGQEHLPLGTCSLVTLKDIASLGITDKYVKSVEEVESEMNNGDSPVKNEDGQLNPDGDKNTLEVSAGSGNLVNYSIHTESDKGLGVSTIDGAVKEIVNDKVDSEELVDDDAGSLDGNEDVEQIDEVMDSDDGNDLVSLDFAARGTVLTGDQIIRLDRFFLDPEIPWLENISDEKDDLEAEEDSAELNKELREVGNLLDGVTLNAEGAQNGEQTGLVQFSEEVAETIARAFSENIDIDNTTTEIKSLKVAYDCSFPETVCQVVGSIARQVEISTSSSTKLYGALVMALKKYGQLISNFNDNENVEHHKEVAIGLADMLHGNGILLMYIFRAMYEEDMLHEDGILNWSRYEQSRIESGATDSQLLDTIRPLIDWFEDEEEEEEEEETEESEEGSE